MEISRSRYRGCRRRRLCPCGHPGKQSGQGVCKAVLESRHDDAAGTPCHTLHISEDERDGDTVGLARASPRDDNGGVRAYKLRKGVGA